jgi:uncharacterized protein YcgI (DUF1989 family)
VKEWIILAKEYSAFTIRKGRTLRFVDVEGKRVPDLVCFSERGALAGQALHYHVSPKLVTLEARFQTMQRSSSCANFFS